QEDVCSGFICLHGGKCVNTTGQAQCACRAGFTGRICETVISVPVKEGTCPPLPADENGLCPGYLCANDAVCAGSQKCCQTGCSTNVCATPVSTSSQTVGVCDGYCFNSGVCKETGGVASCACVGGFIGERCNDTTTKPGGCPSLPADLSGQCAGTSCSSDAACPDTQKCCLNACSKNVCAKPVPDIARCDIRTCPTGSSCFLVRPYAGARGEAKCVLDADRSCWASGYARAHLIPSKSTPGQFDTIPCGSFTWFGRTCPLGTRCSWSGISFPSVCCSDRLVAARFQNSYWSRRLHIYRREAGDDPCGGCQASERCVEVPVQCVAPPCDPRYRCEPEMMPPRDSMQPIGRSASSTSPLSHNPYQPLDRSHWSAVHPGVVEDVRTSRPEALPPTDHSHNIPRTPRHKLQELAVDKMIILALERYSGHRGKIQKVYSF
ncbi:neurogenic locus notch-like protein 3, partial [Elysia marginata]